jgi:hypothetical protein
VLTARSDPLLVSIVALLLGGYWLSQITGAPVSNDAAQTLRMALNLQRHGVISLDVAPPLQPSMYREPVPVIATALAAQVSDLLLGRADDDEYFLGDRSKYLKYQNIIWFALLSVGTFWACFLLTSSTALSLVATLLLNIHLPLTSSGRDALGLDSLNTEIHCSRDAEFSAQHFSWSAARRDSCDSAAASGLLFGVLV